MATTNIATPKYSNVGAGAIKFLRSPLATLIVLCSALLAQLPHAADVFRLIVMGDDTLSRLHGLTYAVALELAVLLFVVQHRNVESYIFAAVSILVNLSYYYLHGVALLSIAALPAWLVSIALPAAIAQYSHLIVSATEQGETQDATPATPKRFRWQFWRKPTETPATPNDAALAPSVESAAFCGHGEGADVVESPAPTLAQPTMRKVGKPGKTNEFGMTDTALAELLGVARQRIEPMRKSGTLVARVARDLPQLAVLHTNGFNRD